MNPNVVDLFMAYTATARAAVGSQSLMVDKINRSVALLNQTLANSKVNVAVRLVGTMETSYTESKVGATDVGRLANTSDGQLDDVTDAANAAGADLTDLVVSDFDVGGITQGNYNVNLLRFLDNGVFSHEFGHTLGGNHQHGAGEDGTHTPVYAYEGTMNFNGNKLSGALGGSVPYYSNPNVMFRGQPTGVGGTGADAADNARVMNDNAAALAGFRPTATPDTAGPVAALATVSSPIGQNSIQFKVRYGDGSGVNVDSLGNSNIIVTGPNGFSAPATLVSVDDPSVNYAYHVAMYQVGTTGPVTDLGAYTFTLQPNSVSDTAGNFAPAGKLTAASTPMLPNYADTDTYLSSEEDDLAGKAVIFSGEVGSKYQMAFATESKQRFSLSSASTMTVSSSLPNAYRPQLWRDANGNLMLEANELIAPTGAGVYANLPAGQNYYLNAQGYNGAGFGDYRFSATFQSPGSVIVPPSTLAGVVYTDTNDNGTQDAGEPGLAGIVVNLTGKDDRGTAVNVTATTDASGAYIFNNLRPSDSQGYDLTEKAPASIPAGKSAAGSLGGFALAGGMVRLISVSPGANGTGYLFGMAQAIPGVSLSGSVYFDANNNGVREASEQGIPNVDVTLGGQSAAVIGVKMSLKTDANGDYEFKNLAPGYYSIREIQPAGVLEGKTTAGTLGGDAGLTNFIQTIKVSGVAGTGYLFGEQSLPANPPPPPTTTDQTNTTPQGTGTGGNVLTAPANIVPTFDFSSGFATAQIKYNGNSSLAGNLLQITPQAGGQAGSAYYTTPVNVTKFNTQFSFNTTPGAGTGDGFTFVIQNSGASALGAPGGGMGYQGIDKSIAVKFDLYNNSGEGTSSTGIYLNGAAPGSANSIDLRTNGIDFHNGNTIQVSMAYDGTTLTVTVKDPTTNATATQTYPVNISATVGGDMAFVGFTGGTGGATANQSVSGWSFASQTATASAAAFAMSADAAPMLYAQLIPNQGPFHARSFTFNDDGTYTYVPPPGFVGTDSFKFQAVDENGQVAAAKVTINVTHVNQPPMMQTETLHSNYVLQGQTIDIDLLDELEDHDSLSISFKLGKVSGGSAKLLPDGHTIRFTASTKFAGVAAIAYTCSDGLATSVMDTTVCVIAVPKAPTAANVAPSTKPSTAVSFDVLKSATDPEGVHLCIQSVDDPAHGTARIDTRGTTNPADDLIVYQPDFGFHGTETFKYRIVDFYGTPATATITATVLPGAGLGVDPTSSNLTALDIYGTKGNDTITITKSGDKYAVKMNGSSLGTFKPTGLIGAFGGDGNDVITASGVDRTVALFGDSGNDKLTAGTGKALLVGGAGSDKLYAGSGNGAFITGVVDYATKGFGPLADIDRGATPSLLGYAHDDRVLDEVFAGPGRDRFWATVTGKGTLDVIHGRVNGESVIALL